MTKIRAGARHSNLRVFFLAILAVALFSNSALAKDATLAGCILPVNFDKTAMASLLTATNLKIAARAAGNGAQPVVLTVPLKGVSSTLKRLEVLASN